MTRILIVDDNLPLAENLAEILQDQGFETCVFSDPRQALASIQRGQYALALLDMRMPHLSGMDLYRALKAVDPELRAVAMTAFARDDNVLDALDDGVHAVLSKPVAPADLVDLLHTVLTGPSALVVDDDRNFAANLVEILLHHGVSARAATSCATARATLGNMVPRLLVVDARLPDGDGAQLLHEMGARDVSCQCILMSAWDIRADAAQLLDRNIRFLSKPVAIDTLLQGLPPPREPE
jgi:DNA-binding NtrC family response regulator